jgi:hypothetical protein
MSIYPEGYTLTQKLKAWYDCRHELDIATTGSDHENTPLLLEAIAEIDRMREVLIESKEMFAYLRQYFVKTGLSALEDCDGMIKVINSLTESKEEK